MSDENARFHRIMLEDNAQSHFDLDIACPSMSDVDRRRIHGDRETDRWLARIHGYND